MDSHFFLPEDVEGQDGHSLKLRPMDGTFLGITAGATLGHFQVLSQTRFLGKELETDNGRC